MKKSSKCGKFSWKIDEFSKKCPAVTHIDLTARPQIVHKDQDPFLWELLKEWENLSGEMALVNTSFNVHEEPIVCSVSEAVDALIEGLIDVLYVEDVKISVVKNNEKPWKLKQNLALPWLFKD